MRFIYSGLQLTKSRDSQTAMLFAIVPGSSLVSTFAGQHTPNNSSVNPGMGTNRDKNQYLYPEFMRIETGDWKFRNYDMNTSYLVSAAACVCAAPRAPRRPPPAARRPPPAARRPVRAAGSFARDEPAMLHRSQRWMPTSQTETSAALA